LPRRRADPARRAGCVAHAGDPLRRWRPDPGARARPDPVDRDRRHVRRARGAAPDRDARDPPERSAVIEDRQLLDQTHQPADELRAHTAVIADEFLRGFATVDRIDRPAVSIFGSARVATGSATYAAARETGKLFA